MAISSGSNGNGSSGNGHGSLHYALPPPETAPRQRSMMGSIVRGSLQAGMQMKLTGSVEEIRAGKFVVVDGAKHEFFAMITDVSLDCVAPGVLANPPSGAEPDLAFLRSVLAGTSAYGTVTLKPLLMRVKGMGGEFEPVKTVPTHFSGVGEATEDDIADIFGAETEGGKHFHVGGAAGHGRNPSLPGFREAGGALERHLRQVRHGQNVSDPHLPLRHDQAQKGR